MELRLTLIDDSNPDRVAAFRFTPEQILDELTLKYDPFPRDPIEQIKARNKRHDLIVRVATLLGHNIADFMDDRDGFNGERREEIIASTKKHG